MCPTCGNRYRRQDVYRRHIKNNCDGLMREAAGTHNRRVQRACDRCRMQKLKCDGNLSCHRCNSRSITCVYSENHFGSLDSQASMPMDEFHDDQMELETQLSRGPFESNPEATRNGNLIFTTLHAESHFPIDPATDDLVSFPESSNDQEMSLAISSTISPIIERTPGGEGNSSRFFEDEVPFFSR